jgi:hypothetical protein
VVVRQELIDGLCDHETEWLRDDRDLMMWMAPLHFSMRRAGLDVVAEFDAAAEAGPESLRELVKRFGRRTDITPRAFGFEPDP